MKKQVTAREFLHHFARLEKELRPGESITVTRRGEPVGNFTKKVTKSAVSLPDFAKRADDHGFSTQVGDQLLARIMNDEAVS